MIYIITDTPEMIQNYKEDCSIDCRKALSAKYLSFSTVKIQLEGSNQMFISCEIVPQWLV